MKLKKTIAVAELRALLENKIPVQILDVRPKEEREEWIIPGSVFVDVYDQLKSGEKDLFSEALTPKNTPVITVCAAGKTSLIAMEQLRKNGIEAYSLDGGMRAWTSAWNTATTVDRLGTTIIQIRRTGKGCLSYLLESKGEVIVIDASLDAAVYSTIAKKKNWKIKYVIDTHIHADHFSRGKKLAEISGASLYLPKQKTITYPFNPIQDGAMLRFGDAVLEAIHTPEHTHESYSYSVNDESLFTGDTLFTEGVGRPDLKATKEIAKEKTSLLYQSLKKIMSLKDTLNIYPGHTSNPVPFDELLISKKLQEIKHKVAVLHLNEEDFIASLLNKIPETPPNYEAIVQLNLKGEANGVNLIELEAGANRCAIS